MLFILKFQTLLNKIMIPRKKRQSEEINASSMADIAFLLLIFFLVTTTIASDKGVTMFLPPFQNEDAPPPPKLKDKNVFVVVMNSADRLMVEEKPFEPGMVKEECKKFLSNNGKDPKSSDNPQSAVVSIKADRGTTYVLYAEVLDQIKTAYHELRAESVGITVEQYMQILNTKDGDRTPKEQKLYDSSKNNYPLQISEAEPSKL